jgi:hypothetical protein
MKLFSPQNIIAIAIVLAFPVMTYAGFNGPAVFCGNDVTGKPISDPQLCNVPGPLWLNTTGSAQQHGTIRLTPGDQFQINSNESSTYSFGNWSLNGDTQSPFSMNVNGELDVNAFAPYVGTGIEGKVQAYKYCFNKAVNGITNDCITSWPVGGGGTLTGITAGTGVSVSGASPSPTVSLNTAYSDGRYVQKAGDSMTGRLSITAVPSTYGVVDANASAGGSGIAVSGRGSAQGGYFDGSTFGVNAHTSGGTAITTSGGNTGVDAQGSSYGVRATATVAGSGTAVQGYNGSVGGDFTGSIKGVMGRTTAPSSGTAFSAESGATGFSAVNVATGADLTGSSVGVYAKSANTAGSFNNTTTGVWTWLGDNSGYGLSTTGNVQANGFIYSASYLMAGSNGVYATANSNFNTFGSGSVVLDQYNMPMITRSYDQFTSGSKIGYGRWGLFMEPSTLVAGIPNIAGKAFNVGAYNPDGTIGKNLLYVNQNGNVYIDTGGLTLGNGGVSNLTMVNGTAAKPGGGSWAVYSDARLKDVHGNFSRGLSDLMGIQPVSYNYKKDNAEHLPSDQTYIGVVAQELQKAVPEAVTEGKDGYLSVNNDPVIWTMVNSIKELKTENDQLKKENDDIKARLDAIEAKLK